MTIAKKQEGDGNIIVGWAMPSKCWARPNLPPTSELARPNLLPIPSTILVGPPAGNAVVDQRQTNSEAIQHLPAAISWQTQ